jgi:hypothetical protein
MATNSYSLFTIELGYDCFHNGEYYATVPTSMACPDPDTGISNGIIGEEYMDRHDPNDHNCVISRVRRNQLN